MATYAIGDIQGCQQEFLDLLDTIGFDPACDHLWLCGDLVNRGPRSADVLRTVIALGDAVTCVLGNHDLHLMALADLPLAAPRRRDTIDDVLRAPDRMTLLQWLRRQPLFHYDAELGFAMVHAGLPPAWTVNDAIELGAEVQQTLTDDNHYADFLLAMYGDEPARWDPELRGTARLRFITNCLTRMRYLTADGRLDLNEKRSPTVAQRDLEPWFSRTPRASSDIDIVFGHWSTLSLSARDCARYRVWPLDTGAVWGGRLTALRLDDRTLFSVPSRQPVAH